MTNSRSTKSTLLSSVVAMLLCISMLIGTTFAWFTDEVVSANNIIASGNLDIVLEYWNGSAWDTVEAADDILAGDKWEPGYTDVAYLRVKNNGSLALKYSLGVNIISETAGVNAAGESFNLSDYIYFDVVEGVNGETGAYATREEAMAHATENTLISEGYARPGELEVGSPFLYLALIVHMPKSVGNVANHNGTDIPEINLGINVFATQHTSEEDSFGNDYDKLATVDSEAELAEALAADLDLIIIGSDIALTEGIEIPADKELTINLMGNTISLAYEQIGTHYALINNMGTLTIDDSIGGGKISYADIGTGGEYASNTIRNQGVLNVLGGTIENTSSDAVMSAGYPHAIDAYQGSVTNINGGMVKSVNYDCIRMFCNSNTIPTTVNISGGTIYNRVTFQNPNNNTNVTGYGILNISGGNFVTTDNIKANVRLLQFATDASMMKATITGGTFDKGVGVSNYTSAAVVDEWMSVSGGTFGTDPTPYLADGYKAIAHNGTYMVISEDIAVVTDAVSLKTALSDAGAAGSGDSTITILGDIDMTGTAWTPISVDGYHGADIVTIEGNGATIKGLTAPLFAGGFAGGSGIVIKDLTIADSNIISSNTIGSGAFIESVDSMNLITLDNCHLVNSTVTGGDGSRTGGLIGWTAGYNNVNDGPVKTYVTITNCSVIDCTITSNGSVGGIYGHAGNNSWTYSTVENCTVMNCDLISTDDGGWRVGVVVGTANVGEMTINNITESGNTLSQTGKTAPAGQSNLYGRFVPGTTGKLVIDGTTL